eukprot:TRINITY_DN24406_c0_g1_i1.p2 TRINITY_DN24406_c0_g1~~TRINITY_DN24406_c0_g1_i1.p2  ORF type:complete len:115 (+),score=15.63 TRINITY_DN24406_c0_g1_i1:648-992(+)
MDGDVSAVKQFDVECSPAGDSANIWYHDFGISCFAFETATTCFPVVCGLAPSVANAVSAWSSDLSAALQFDVECSSTGNFNGLKQCVRLSCPTTDVGTGLWVDWLIDEYCEHET